MTATRLLFLSVLLIGAALSVTVDTKYYYELHGDMELTEEKIRQMYIDFSEEFKKPVSFEPNSRFDVFRDKVKMIAAHNANPANTWEMGINKFTDVTDEEFMASHLGAAQECSATEHNLKRIPVNEPMDDTNFDWRDQDPNPVSKVKDQGSCGSCWTFSTTGCLEAHWALYRSENKLFSEQQLVDCA